MACYLAMCVHLGGGGAPWPWRPYPKPLISVLQYNRAFLFYFILDSTLFIYLFFAPQSSSPGHGSHSFIFLFFADWSGKWHSSPLLQPVQFKVKWCVLSETSFCTPLLYWAVIYLWPVNLNKFWLSPLTSLASLWGAYPESSKRHLVWVSRLEL